MKYIHRFKIVVSCLLFLAVSCQKDDITKLNDCHLKNFIKSVSNVEGTIWYDAQAKTYAAYIDIDGHYDTQIIGLFCNLPDVYKREGVKISFSGNFYECKEFTPLIPGQEYSYLELTNVKSVLE